MKKLGGIYVSETKQKTARIASEWWAKVISNPKFDVGDDSLGGILAETGAKSLTSVVQSEQQQTFASILFRKIVSNLENGINVDLDVDYGASRMLIESAKEAGINTANFPWKTNMTLEDGFVSVSYGSRASHEILYETKAYWQKQIDFVTNKMEEYQKKRLGNGESKESREESIASCMERIEKYNLSLRETIE
jgi:hypothetical protein